MDCIDDDGGDDGDYNKEKLFGCCRPETVSELLNHMFAGDETVDSVVTSGLFVLQTLLEFRRLG